jgi:hypothetical protein
VAIVLGGLLVLGAALALPDFGAMLRMARPPAAWLGAACLTVATMLAGLQFARFRRS